MSHSHSQLVKWWVFTSERFPPFSSVTMILIFLLAHFGLLRSDTLQLSGLSSAAEFFCLFGGTLAFFFKLRLYDEIKDYEVDLKLNPTRPLARGLLKHQDLYQGIALCIGIELLCFSLFGRAALLTLIGAIVYSLLMYKEFFVPQLLRPHLTAYAVSHTVVSAFLSLSILSALSATSVWEMDWRFFAFSLNSWCLFNIFEFGRKTFASQEERSGVESYSKIFGRYGAIALVLSMALLSFFLLESLHLPSEIGLRIYTLSIIGILSISALLYTVINRPSYGALYRGMSSIYIVLVYLGLVGVQYAYP